MKLIQSGHKNAKIVVVGEAPGEREESSGLPFVGGSGQLLDQMFERTGLDRGQMFLTNVCHVRPPANKFEWFYTKAGIPHYAQGVVQLKKDIQEIRPNLVIALGTNPLRAVTSKVGIEKWRGSILESKLVPGVKVIGTFHPAAIMRTYDYKAVAEFDLARCAEQAEFPDIRIPVRKHILDPAPGYRAMLVDELLSASWLAVDIECWLNDKGEWELACCGFSDRPDRSVVIPASSVGGLHDIRILCESPVRKVFQNGMFDVTVLRSSGIYVANFAWDTMLAHHALFAECASGSDELSSMARKKRSAAIQKGLAFQASIYTLEPFYKDDGKQIGHGDLQAYWLYNGKDCTTTREIRDVQDREIESFGVREVFDREMALVTPLMTASNRGFKIDTVYREELKSEYLTKVTNLQALLNKLCGRSVNVKSPIDMKWLLYEKLGFKPKYNKGSKNPTADKDAINEFAGRSNRPELHTILAIREFRDFIERYISARLDSDGRMRCSFDVTGTRSGRLSSRASLSGSGTNLHTIPARKKEGAKLRRMFIADEGKIFVYPDYKQAEAWVVAFEARCEGLIELFTDPTRDVHRENASRIFGKPLVGITTEERYLAKRVVHASNYGMGPDRLVELVAEDAATTGIRIDRREAAALMDKYFMLYPEIKENFWRQVEMELRRSRTLTTFFGRKRTFYGRFDDKLLREAYSYKPQSTVGDLGNEATIRAFAAIDETSPTCLNREWGGQYLVSVHDSILFQCNRESVHEVAKQLQSSMTIPITINGRTFTIPTDCQVGYNWAKQSPENPRGLVDIEKWDGN